MSERDVDDEVVHFHEWETGEWGVIVGVSRCAVCGKVSERSDFEYARLAAEPGLGLEVDELEWLPRMRMMVTSGDYVGFPTSDVRRLLDIVDRLDRLARLTPTADPAPDDPLYGVPGQPSTRANR